LKSSKLGAFLLAKPLAKSDVEKEHSDCFVLIYSPGACCCGTKRKCLFIL